MVLNLATQRAPTHQIGAGRQPAVVQQVEVAAAERTGCGAQSALVEQPPGVARDGEMKLVALIGPVRARARRRLCSSQRLFECDELFPIRPVNGMDAARLNRDAVRLTEMDTGGLVDAMTVSFAAYEALRIAGYIRHPNEYLPDVSDLKEAVP